MHTSYFLPFIFQGTSSRLSMFLNWYNKSEPSRLYMAKAPEQPKFFKKKKLYKRVRKSKEDSRLPIGSPSIFYLPDEDAGYDMCDSDFEDYDMCDP